MYYHYYCTGQYAQYDLTSDCTFGSNRVMDWINPSGPDESGGIFTSGQYNWAVYDTAGDGLDGGSGYYIQTRSPGGSWSTVQSITGWVGSGITGSVTVAQGDEMRLAYNCPSGSGGSGSYYACYTMENYMTITPGRATVTIPGAVVGVGGSAPTGSEAADVSFSVGSGEEAYMQFTSGPNLVTPVK